MKVSFANEIENISKSLDIDSHKLMDIFCKDKILNISNYYLNQVLLMVVRVYLKIYYGLQTIGKSLKLDLPVLNSISYSNDLQIDRAFNIIKNFKESDILILGVTFKKDTDDLRNSPSVSLLIY